MTCAPRSRPPTRLILPRVSRCALLPWPGCAGQSSPRCSGPISQRTSSPSTAARTVVRRDGESWVDDVATKTGTRRTLTLDAATVDAIAELRAARDADLAVPLLRHDRARQPRSHRMVVDPSPGSLRDRPEVAPPRSAALDRDHRDHQRARRTHRRRPPRARQSGDDAAGLRPCCRGSGPRARQRTRRRRSKISVASDSVRENRRAWTCSADSVSIGIPSTAFCRRNGVRRLAVFGVRAARRLHARQRRRLPGRVRTRTKRQPLRHGANGDGARGARHRSPGRSANRW